MEEIKRFNKNGILTGQWDSYCLVCKEIIKSGDDIEIHINKETHLTNLKNCKMVEGTVYDRIRKLPKGYYCEKCNHVVSSRSQLKKHILESDHINPKDTVKASKLTVQFIENHVVVFDCLKIDTSTWNVIIDNSCMLCKVDHVPDVTAHLNEIDHIIKLIETVVVRKKYYLYRKRYHLLTSQIPGLSRYQCLTCNLLFPKENKLQHMNGEYHDSMFKKASRGLIMEKSQKHYDINEQLQLENFMRKDKCCLVCNWDINNDQKHVKHYHHENIVKMHWKWIDRHRKFVILGRENEYLSESDESEMDEEEVTTSEHENTVKVESVGQLEANENDKSAENVEVQPENTSNLKVHKDQEIKDSMNAGPADVDISICQRLSKMKIFSNLDVQAKIKEAIAETVIAGSSKDLNLKKIQEDLDNPGEMPANNKPGEKRSIQTTQNYVPNRHERKTSHSKANRAIIEYGKEFMMSYRSGRFACNYCKLPVEESIKGIRAHVMAPPHKTDTSLLNILPSDCDERIRLDEFQRSCDDFFSVNRGYTIYNRMFCLSLLSFNCFMEAQGRIRCFLCHQDINEFRHAFTEPHRRQLGRTLIIKKFEKHFVREISPNVYHCGKCNIIINEWEDLLLHLVSRSHKMQYEAYETLCLVNLKGMAKKLELARQMISQMPIFNRS